MKSILKLEKLKNLKLEEKIADLESLLALAHDDIEEKEDCILELKKVILVLNGELNATEIRKFTKHSKNFLS